MKINTLALKNLNSLRGEFRLDFDAPPLADAGIFAITGHTGAGKTTILDAICVALYGQTPRLSSGSSAELLTRNTGECFAEVEFTVEQGRFRSRWSRRRARGRSDGSIQPTTMELVQIDGIGEERILEDQVRQVIERVESLTGLDFPRFTRSVMLAQGSFASFLKAKDNERAELLERMTGTRLYSFISIQAFTRAREERQRLDEMIALNAHLEIMPPEQLAELANRKAGLSSSIVMAKNVLAAKREQMATALRYRELSSVIAEAEQALVELNADEAAAAPMLARLANAEAALPLLANLRSLDSLGLRLERLRAEAAEISGQAEAARKEQEDVRQARAILAQEHDRFDEAAACQEETIRKAELLDQQIRLHVQDLASREQMVAACDGEIAALRPKCRTHSETMAAALSRLQNLDGFLVQYAADAGLGQDGAIIAGSLRELAISRQRYATNKREQERVTAGVRQQEQEACDLRQRLDAAILTCTNQREGLALCADRLAEALQGKSFEDVEAGIASARNHLERLDAVLARDADLRRITSELAAKKTRRDAIAQDRDADGGRRQRLKADLDHAGQVLALLEEQERLAALVAKYESDRGHLAAGLPCPLCGATHHPWQNGAPARDDDREAVERQRRQVAALLSELGALEGRMQELFVAEATLSREITTLAEGNEQALAAWQEAMAAAGLADAAPASEAKAACLGGMAADQERLALARGIQATQEGLRQTLLNEEKTEAAIAAELETLRALLGEQGAAVLRLQEEERQLCQHGSALSAKLESLLALYRLPVPALGLEDDTAEALRERWQRFDQARQDRAVVEAQILEIKRALAVLTVQEAGLESRREQEVSAAKEARTIIDSLTAERRAILGDETVEAARGQLAVARAALATQVKESDGVIAELATRVATLSGVLTENRQQSEQAEQERQAVARAIDERLPAAGFSDQKALRQAMLADADLQALRQRREGLTFRRQRLNERLLETRVLRESLDGEAAGLDPDALYKAIAEAEAVLAAQQQELGALDETIRRQEELTVLQQQRSFQIERQRRELHHWQLLSDMIGSADGKKFRRFAQGLTLDHLIFLANRQLVRLSDRYLLRRHQSEELGLEIIDTYQADAIRPTGTLSGGEEFLVSLALALGLASLSGQTRIDSLFLDEGFGTLDTDTLETALAALAALHESGKTIGVISHVDALKERIPVQIRLRKLSGGYSDLSVAG